jgi:hypothetical protein
VTDEDIDAFSDGCWPIVLDFLERTDLPDELAFWFYHPVRHDDLDQSVVCIVGPDGDRQFTESLKGIGSAPLPFA